MSEKVSLSKFNREGDTACHSECEYDNKLKETPSTRKTVIPYSVIPAHNSWNYARFYCDDRNQNGNGSEDWCSNHTIVAPRTAFRRNLEANTSTISNVNM